MMNGIQNYGMTNNYQVGFKAKVSKPLLEETIGLTKEEAKVRARIMQNRPVLSPQKRGDNQQ